MHCTCTGHPSKLLPISRCSPRLGSGCLRHPHYGRSLSIDTHPENSALRLLTRTFVRSSTSQQGGPSGSAFYCSMSAPPNLYIDEFDGEWNTDSVYEPDCDHCVARIKSWVAEVGCEDGAHSVSSNGSEFMTLFDATSYTSKVGEQAGT